MSELSQSQSPQTRMTRQRAIILEELRKLTSHPTADELYQIVRTRLPKISLGTVYRNLVFLTESGQILRLESAGSTNRFDANLQPHQHVRCVCCGRVADVYPPHPAPRVGGLTASGFARILDSRVEYDGLCEDCASGKGAEQAERMLYHHRSSSELYHAVGSDE